ncbi:Glycerate kinase [Amphibalanus amphitrite]|uniref:Glycerate kinase n=1 Tax=Amphibalanus amphitrite TaxID=1232801 RepID=A0A6A4VUF3_AMPAM|nr:Glycerate kinase [Amphibalanus amphitrite]
MAPAGARLRQLAAVAVDAVSPDQLVQRTLRRTGDRLTVTGRQYELNHNVYLVGAGKAVLAMARAAEEALRPHLVRGVLSVPAGGPPPPPPPALVEVHRGAVDNLPDAAAERAAGRIAELAAGLRESDLLLVLVSGGGSALLPAPRPPLTLADKARLTRELAARGASIQELNAVRRALSLLKGGGLARLAAPASCLALILSDVIGDPLELIASGPTVAGSGAEPASAAAAAAVLGRHRLLDEPGVREALAAAAADWERSPAAADGRVHNVLVGSNRLALEAMRAAAAADHRAELLSAEVRGDCGAMAGLLAQLAARLASGRPAPLPADLAAGLAAAGIPPEAVSALRPPQPGRPLCLLLGGETTVTVTGAGRGGRNQQLALAFAVELERLWTALAPGRPPAPVALLCFGTDGADGPTDAAGAVVDGATAAAARAQQLEPQHYLADNDSYGFFARFDGGSHHVLTGPTGTNVMDVMALVVEAEGPGPASSL